MFVGHVTVPVCTWLIHQCNERALCGQTNPTSAVVAAVEAAVAGGQLLRHRANRRRKGATMENIFGGTTPEYTSGSVCARGGEEGERGDTAVAAEVVGGVIGVGMARAGVAGIVELAGVLEVAGVVGVVWVVVLVGMVMVVRVVGMAGVVLMPRTGSTEAEAAAVMSTTRDTSVSARVSGILAVYRIQLLALAFLYSFHVIQRRERPRRGARLL